MGYYSQSVLLQHQSFKVIGKTLAKFQPKDIGALPAYTNNPVAGGATAGRVSYNSGTKVAPGAYPLEIPTLRKAVRRSAVQLSQRRNSVEMQENTLTMFGGVDFQVREIKESVVSASTLFGGKEDADASRSSRGEDVVFTGVPLPAGATPAAPAGSGTPVQTSSVRPNVVAVGGGTTRFGEGQGSGGARAAVVPGKSSEQQQPAVGSTLGAPRDPSGRGISGPREMSGPNSSGPDRGFPDRSRRSSGTAFPDAFSGSRAGGKANPRPPTPQKPRHPSSSSSSDAMMKQMLAPGSDRISLETLLVRAGG